MPLFKRVKGPFLKYKLPNQNLLFRVKLSPDFLLYRPSWLIEHFFNLGPRPSTLARDVGPFGLGRANNVHFCLVEIELGGEC